jgi:hypothetical protein
MKALAVLGLAALSLPLLAAWLRGGSSTAVPAHRVMVALHENRTGEPLLDPIGAFAAEWIAQALSRAEAVEVIITAAARPEADGIAEIASDDAVPGPRGTPADRSRAALLVSGAFYRQGDSIQFHTRIADARTGQLLRALEPVSVPASDPTAALELIGRRTAGALAVVLDTRLAAIGNLASQPQNIEAYHALLEGLDRNFADDLPGALAAYERSLALDPTYLFPVTHIGFVRLYLGEPAAADSIARVADRSRDRMTPFERALLDVLVAALGEDPVAQYQARKRAATLGPGSGPHVRWAANALRLNRPREALRILSTIDPISTAVGSSYGYWATLTAAHHMLGWHRRELRQARRARALFPNEPWTLLLEARSHAARGRTRELEAIIAARRSLPDSRNPSIGTLMSAVGHELRAHRHHGAAQHWYERAIDWYHTRPPEEQAQAAHRLELAFVLFAAGRIAEAEMLFHALATSDPENLAVLGAVGALAAQRGKAAEAERIDDWLATLRRQYHNGPQLLWRGCIAAHRGDLAAAVTLLQEAAGRAELFDHTHSCLDPLRDHAPFREWMRPRD